MYETTPACFFRSGVMKMPLMTASQRFEFSAGMSPGNAVFEAEAVSPHVFARAAAMSTSKPTILPLEVVFSIGGELGSVQYLKVALARPAAPAAKNAKTTAGGTSDPMSLRNPFCLLFDPEAGSVFGLGRRD